MSFIQVNFVDQKYEMVPYLLKPTLPKNVRLKFVSTIMNTPVVPETEEALEPRKNIKKVAPVPEEKGQVVVTKGHEESAWTTYLRHFRL